MGGLGLAYSMFDVRGGSAPPNGNPSSLALTVLSDTSIKLDWTIGSTNQDGHKIYVSTNGIDFTLLDSVLGVTATYNATGLTQGSIYYFKVAAYKGSKLSEYSNIENATTTLAAPTALTSQFIVDTILGQIDFTDNSGGVAQHEVYSNTNAAGAVLLTTLGVGVVTYNDTTCKQNASVVYTVRAKKGSVYSTYATAAALVTPLCFKTNQTTRTDLYINSLYVAAGKTVNIDWGDGSNQNTTGSVTNITHTYAASATNIFNVKLSGDIGDITRFYIISQPLRVFGDISNWRVPSGCTLFYMYSNAFTGKAPSIISSASALLYRVDGNSLSGTNITMFRVAATGYFIGGQNVTFSTAEVNAFLKAAADWYQVNAPTANCTFDLSGANMGIPTGGASNSDLLRLAGYFVAAGKTPTIVISS